MEIIDQKPKLVLYEQYKTLRDSSLLEPSQNLPRKHDIGKKGI